MFIETKSHTRSRLPLAAALLAALLSACAAPDPAPVSPVRAADRAELNRPTASPSPAASSASRPAPPEAAPGRADAGQEALASPAAKPVSDEPIAKGLASWYGPKFHGRRTASGERYDMHELTAAHKTLPFGTKVRVRSLQTGKEVVVRINDRGPYSHRRIIDLSLAAITALGVRHRGVATVVLLSE